MTGDKEERINEIIETTRVDAYSRDEQLIGFYVIMDEQMDYPFSIEILEEEYQVIGIEEKCGQLKWKIYKNQKNHLIDITDTEIINKNSDNYLYVEAYRRWLRCS